MFKSRPSGGMLGSVGAKIAHASTIPSLGNPALRTLQDLITAEKGVLTSVQRLATDVGKGADALKSWGVGEGDDLGDVLSHSTNLLAQFSAALIQYASYEEQIRTQLKSIRTREENLDEMKRRKRSVDHKADGADKKLAKMGSEHKGRMAQVELLNELKEEGRKLEADIMREEVAIGDYKRRTTREFLALKFAGMVELAEKATIIGDLGKLMIEEIPLQTTVPGYPRAPYTGREKTSELSSEALRCIGEVRLNLSTLPESAPPFSQPYNQYNGTGSPTPGGDVTQGTFGSMAPRGQVPYDEFGEIERPTRGSGFSTSSLRIGDDGSRIGNTGAGQFHTLPASGGFSGGLPPISLGDHGREETFSSSVADALSQDPNFSGPHGAPTSPSSQQTVPPGAYVPPHGPAPSMPQHTSETYFSRGLPDLTRPDSPLLPPHVLSGSLSWASAPSSPQMSRALPPHPPLDAEDDSTSLAYARDSPAPPTPNKSTTFAQTTTHDDFYNPYESTAHNQAPSPQPPRDESPVRHPQHEQHEIESAAAREVSREMDVLSMAPYASPPPRRQSMGTSSPPPPQLQPLSYEPHPSSAYTSLSDPPHGPVASSPYAPTPPPPESTHAPAQTQETPYGTPSEYPNPFSAPLPRPPAHLPSPSVSAPSPQSPGSSGRTISAGAFRRNVSRSDTLDSTGPLGIGVPPSVSPLSFRKKTPVGAEDHSRGSSPAPTSPGAPPVYSAIDGEVQGSSNPTSGGGYFLDSKQPPRNE